MLQVALGQLMASWFPSSNKIWFNGYFSPSKVILGAKVTNVTGDAMYFMLMMMVGCIGCVDVRQHFSYSISCKIGKKMVLGFILSRMLVVLLIVGFKKYL